MLRLTCDTFYAIVLMTTSINRAMPIVHLMYFCTHKITLF